ncbi:MAG: ABC transporter ATP-binding protein, partial [Lactimicrobium massiliense]
MLQIRNVKKEYRTGDLVQKALDGVSVNLRDNEFVAILGPSGSGKTTLLNVIGGLDRYDSGELIINGLTTRKYKDKDWDYYRNHMIGFVFQSYNLIPHQTILANVELALTISGISGKKRHDRAVKALEKVGLGNQIHKKPAQLSGGQMQRVAIARALVNDPQIVLADEPTGALDSETSIQVMELLKEVARDRLVVMVTHNPDLAHQYATRIITIKDGHLIKDTNPYIIENEQAIVKKTGKSSMNFLTALQLSFQNLRTKKARTLLVSIAGSIGIIGIALIMSISNGVQAYIRKTERETMSEYPLQINELGMDMDAMINGARSDSESQMSATADPDATGAQVKNTLARQSQETSDNDLSSLKTYLESNETIQDHARAIEYKYGITPRIYLVQND